jgi:PAS domain S-box-containing protein
MGAKLQNQARLTTGFPGQSRQRSELKPWLLYALLLLFVAPLLGGTYWMYRQSREQIAGAELRGDLLCARTLSAIAEQDFLSAENILTSIADRPSVREEWDRRDLASIKTHLEEARKLEPAFLFVGVYDVDGTMRAIEPPDKNVGNNFAYRDWYRGVSARWQPYVSEVYRTTTASRSLVVAVAVPIRNALGNVTGIAIGAYSLAQLAGKVNAIEKGDTREYFIVDQHGVVAASPEIDAQSEPVHFSAPSLAARALAGEEGSQQVQIDGKSTFAGFAPVPRIGWGVIYARSEAVAMAPALQLKRENRSATLYLLLVYLATAILAAILMRRQTQLLSANQALNRELAGQAAESKKAREELDRFFMLSVDLLCIAGEDGYFKRLNPSWEKVLGYSVQELLAVPYVQFIHPDDVDSTVKEAEGLSKGRSAIAFTNRYRCNDGSYRWFEWNATPVIDGGIIFAMARDVTELKAVQSALISAKEEAERSNKFKDQFLSTMSHELRTPLNAVLGFSDLLGEERYGPLNDRQQRYIAHIHTGGKHLLTLINDILDLSKIEAGRLQLTIENVGIKKSFAEALDAMRPLADKKSHVLLLNADEDLNVLADSTRLKQILMNLIGNAVKFTPEGGRIEVTAHEAGDAVRLEVRDSGPGIPPEEKLHIFEAFYRLRQSSKAIEGTGLGLAITQRLVELQGGQLGLESEVGKGSCFYFTLPGVPPVEERIEPETGARVLAAGPARILVLEDDPVAAHLLETYLTSVGYEVLLCHDSGRALEIATEMQPQAITMDIVMKPVNGWELLSQLKSDPRTEKIPVIIVSIVDQPTTGALLGADEYIVKPVDKTTLLTAINSCMGRQGHSRQMRPILVVDDDAPTREFIAELLVKHGYAVGTAANAAEARVRVANSMPELVILDLVMPDVSGFQLLAEWRANVSTADLPVFVLTSKDLAMQELDYLCKHAGALSRKQESWQDALLRQLNRAVPPMVAGKI